MQRGYTEQSAAGLLSTSPLNYIVKTVFGKRKRLSTNPHLHTNGLIAKKQAEIINRKNETFYGLESDLYTHIYHPLIHIGITGRIIGHFRILLIQTIICKCQQIIGTCINSCVIDLKRKHPER